MTEAQKKVALKHGYVPMFADRDTLQEAYGYAMKIANSCSPSERAHVITAIHVLTNTVAKLWAISEVDDE